MEPFDLWLLFEMQGRKTEEEAITLAAFSICTIVKEEGLSGIERELKKGADRASQARHNEMLTAREREFND